MCEEVEWSGGFVDSGLVESSVDVARDEGAFQYPEHEVARDGESTFTGGLVPTSGPLRDPTVPESPWGNWGASGCGVGGWDLVVEPFFPGGLVPPPGPLRDPAVRGCRQGVGPSGWTIFSRGERAIMVHDFSFAESPWGCVIIY